MVWPGKARHRLTLSPATVCPAIALNPCASAMLTYPLRRSCKEVAALVVAREDRRLSVSEKLALRAHMLICEACPHFEQQILTMRNALRQWRNYAGDSVMDGAAAGESPAGTAAVHVAPTACLDKAAK